MNKQEIMIHMQDGVRLQNFLYLPSGEGPFPALLARCMYGADRVEKRAMHWVEQGYAVLLQNIRGRHGSEGGQIGRGDFPEDGYSTMEWMTKQPWCSGRIGTFGRSALARVQTATAFLAHPAHRAMAPVVLPYKMLSRLGGTLMFSQIPQWMYLAQSGPELAPVETVEWMPHLYKLPLTAVLDDVGGPIDEYREVVKNAHAIYLSDPIEPDEFPKLDTPNLMITGWYDHCATGSVDFFMHTMQYATESQKRNTHLVIGPWDHGVSGDVANEYDFGPDANLDHTRIEAEFFDTHLKEGAATKPLAPVKIFVMGRNEWRDEQEWPLARATEKKLFLHSDGDVSGAWRRGTLSFDPPADEKPDFFTYDPADPVPTWGGANSGPSKILPMKRGARDQRITLYRKDVLTYFSERLQEPLEVTGMLRMVLYASSSAVDTDFTAKLMDVAPDGNARLVSDGVIRARYRNGLANPDSLDPARFENGLAHPEMLEPGEIYRFDIDLWFTSNEFQPGHSIAVAISSSNFPRIDRNLNTGGDNQQESDYVTADQMVFHDAQHPSHIVLPIITS